MRSKLQVMTFLVYIPCEILCCRENECQLDKLTEAGGVQLGCQWPGELPQAGMGEEASLEPVRQRVEVSLPVYLPVLDAKGQSQSNEERPQACLSLSRALDF